MINTFHKSVKYLRMVNVKIALNAITECKPNYVKVAQSQRSDILSGAKSITFCPRTIGVEIRDKPTGGSSKQDPLHYVPIINPRSILPLIESNWRNEEVGLPALNQEEVQAARLIVIRRKKMKKHQRRKLWKKMRHRWARVKQRRRQMKEKTFQNGLLAMVKEANEFSAEAYVAGKLEKANHMPLPTKWRNKRLPEFIIRQLLGIDKKINYKHTDKYKA